MTESIVQSDSIRLILSQLAQSSLVVRAGFPALSSPSEADIEAVLRRRVEQIVAFLPEGEERASLLRHVRLAANELLLEITYDFEVSLNM